MEKEFYFLRIIFLLIQNFKKCEKVVAKQQNQDLNEKKKWEQMLQLFF